MDVDQESGKRHIEEALRILEEGDVQRAKEYLAKSMEDEYKRTAPEREDLFDTTEESDAAARKLKYSFDLLREGTEKVRREREKLEEKLEETKREWDRIREEYEIFEERKLEISHKLEELGRLGNEIAREKQQLGEDREHLEESKLALQREKESVENEREEMESERARLNRMREEFIKERERFDNERHGFERSELYERLKKPQIKKIESEGLRMEDNEEALHYERVKKEGEGRWRDKGLSFGEFADFDSIDKLLSGAYTKEWKTPESEVEMEAAPDTLIAEHPEAVLREGQRVNYFECPDCGFMIEIITTNRPLEIDCASCGSRFRLKGKKKEEKKE
ncbi:MAG: hypothetical protein KAU14_02470, partial [Thermoplasmata archaeon]|nr:hypothetical protein [Thermoplasmata archaeon]